MSSLREGVGSGWILSPARRHIEGPLLAEYNLCFAENPERADFNIPPVSFCAARAARGCFVWSFLFRMSWQQAIERTVTGLGYELVDLERTGGGLLRVTIDRTAGKSYLTGPSEFVLVEDCEAVTRQLQYVLEVENCNYSRLEVSSPGLDRALKREADYARFAGSAVDLTLKLPLGGRRKFKGVLLAREGGGWRLAMEPAAKGHPEQALDFVFDEVREARLVPVVNFKGRQAQGPVRPALESEERTR
jgi:ribosome maturation factor RimP